MSYKNIHYFEGSFFEDTYGYGYDSNRFSNLLSLSISDDNINRNLDHGDGRGCGDGLTDGDGFGSNGGYADLDLSSVIKEDKAP